MVTMVTIVQTMIAIVTLTRVTIGSRVSMVTIVIVKAIVTSSIMRTPGSMAGYFSVLHECELFPIYIEEFYGNLVFYENTGENTRAWNWGVRVG